MKSKRVGSLMVSVVGIASLAALHAACGTNRGDGHLGTADLAAPQGDLAGADFSGTMPPPDDSDGGTLTTADPTTCAEAATSKSYIGCDYWPTVVANPVWTVFDYAVVVSNPGVTAANITVTGGALTTTVTSMVAPGSLVKIGLPWVTSLKGPEFNSTTGTMPLTSSTRAIGGAYHLTSDVPVLLYQFNALEYQSGSGNDLQGIAWSTCPNASEIGVACNSYSNDASLLLPSTAMTPNYVITGVPGDDVKNGGTTTAEGSSYAAITGTVDNTTVTIQLGKTGDILASTDNPVSIPAVALNATTPAKVTYTINAGDVLQLVGGAGSGHDLTGSIVEANQPVQVVVGDPCTTNPTEVVQGGVGKYSCDHIEETVLPVETWGKTYVVTAPNGPDSNVVEHVVRVYGGAMASNLTYSPAVTGAPAGIAASAVVAFTTTTDFYVSGDQPFAISSEQMSGSVVDTTNPMQPSGDPSLSFFSAAEQYRLKYLFLAPTDYTTNFVDIAAPTGTTLTLDGAAVTGTPTAIGGGYSVLRITLAAGTAAGAHTLIGSQPFGIQVMGYGLATSYQYPGGLDLKIISSPPPPIQ